MGLKVYLGDGVYADVDDGVLVLTTEEGRHATNTVYMESEVVQALERFIARQREEKRIR